MSRRCLRAGLLAADGADHFSGPAGAGPAAKSGITDRGTSYPGGPSQRGTGEIQTHTGERANLRVDGKGHLLIIPTRTAAGAWRSARVETRHSDFRPPAGGQLKIEARIQLPDGGQGYWPAFWPDAGAGRPVSPSAGR